MSFVVTIEKIKTCYEQAERLENMRHFVLYESDNFESPHMYIGTTMEIKAVYKSICRNEKNHNIVDFFGGLNERGKFSQYKSMYGLMFDSHKNMTIINSDTALSILFDDGIEKEEVKQLGF